MENTKRKITISLNSVEIELIDTLKKKVGFNSQEILRIGLRLYYAQEIKPVRNPGRPKKEVADTPAKEPTEFKLSPIDYCKNVLNGEVIEKDGVQCCEYQVGACTITDPLTSLRVQ